jgi:hypothetical protein
VKLVFIIYRDTDFFLNSTILQFLKKFWGDGGQGGEMTQALYAHMNNKTIKKKKRKENFFGSFASFLIF